ncbi:sodium calcium cation exchanger having 12 transmembrane domains and signal peptide [Cryptosporidium xiaoi]|uniref:Sodium calcium cation exchanger having 12 transmembrane domains and signal peptide n=1 Tax=Cryptosporidium xiaoi TaxID=659607 RepID=A0AAV9XXI8_9CRYT
MKNKTSYSRKTLLLITLLCLIIISGCSRPALDEYESLSSCSIDEQGSDLAGFDQSHWSGIFEEQTTLIPYSRLFYNYVFEPVIEEKRKEGSKSFPFSIIGIFFNKIVFAMCLLAWSCILFIACGTVADTYISSLMIKLAECLNLSDTFTGSTLLAFSNAASDVILGIVSVSIGEKDAIDVFLGDVIGACLFIILVVFGCVMVFSKSGTNSSYINIPVFNHLRDTMALTIGLIQLLIINHLGYISPKMSFIPLIAYCCYVLLLQWSEKSTSCSMPLSLTIRDEYIGHIYEHVINSKEGNESSEFSLRSSNVTDIRSILYNTTTNVPSIPFTPPDSLNGNRDNSEKFDSNANDLEIPPIKLSFLSSEEDKLKSVSREGTMNKELYWDRIGSKSRSIKKALLLLTPSHSPSPSNANDEVSGRVLTPNSSNSLHNNSIRCDSTLLQDSSEKGALIPGKIGNASRGQRQMLPFQREKLFNNTLEPPPQWNIHRSKSPASFAANSRNIVSPASYSALTTNNSPIDQSGKNVMRSHSRDGVLNSSFRSNSHSELVLVSDDYAVRLSRDLSMSEVVYQTESLYNSLLPPPAHRENVMKLQKRGRMMTRESRTRYIIETSQSFSYRQISGNNLIENVNVPSAEEGEHRSRLSYWSDFEALKEDIFGLLNFIRQLLMTPIMFVLYLTVPSPSLRRSVQIMQPLFIILAVGFEKQMYKNYPLFYLLALLSASILSLILFVIYTCIIPPDDYNSEDCISEAENRSQVPINTHNNHDVSKTQGDDTANDLNNPAMIPKPIVYTYNASSNSENSPNKNQQNFDAREAKDGRLGSSTSKKFVDIDISSDKRLFLKNFLMYCNMLFGIIMSIYWNGVLVNELVECIRVIGLTLGIKPAILGLTIVAMGNSIADLFANVAVSRAGHAHMGLAGCYGACVFLLLFGFGSSVFVRTIQLGFSKDIHLHFESQIITATYQLLYFLPFSALVVVLSKGRVHKVWGLIFILYFIIGMAFILNGII